MMRAFGIWCLLTIERPSSRSSRRSYHFTACLLSLPPSPWVSCQICTSNNVRTDSRPACLPSLPLALALLPNPRFRYRTRGFQACLPPSPLTLALLLNLRVRYIHADSSPACPPSPLSRILATGLAFDPSLRLLHYTPLHPSYPPRSVPSTATHVPALEQS